MSALTRIEWTDASWNPVGGCSIHSPGCTHCYAMRLAVRLPRHPVYAGTVEPSSAGPVWTGRLTLAPENHPLWQWPAKWRGARHPVMGEGKPSLIFVGDMSDLFHQGRRRRDINRVIDTLITARKARGHIAQLLTKRPNVMLACFAERLAVDKAADWNGFWLGCSVERQQEADERRPFMEGLARMGFITFVSYEPALRPVDWSGWEFLAQIISGGESGPRARPSHPDWHRATRDFCAQHGIAYLFKQWGEWVSILDREQQDPDWRCDYGNEYADRGNRRWLNLEGGRGFHGDHFQVMQRIGKANAGRRLDGIEHNGFPTFVSSRTIGAAA